MESYHKRKRKYFLWRHLQMAPFLLYADPQKFFEVKTGTQESMADSGFVFP
jgi:hypothetical protein